MSNQTWHEDPKRLVFLLSRYKFAAKMLSGCDNVLEVGCADAFGTRIVRQEVPNVVASDFDPLFIEDAKSHQVPKWRFECVVHDMLQGSVPGKFDGAYSLDVLEHIQPNDEDLFLKNICGSLKQHGKLVIGSPSIYSQPYASKASKEGHVNCKDGMAMKTFLSKFFHHVFIFSMNDEVVHTGFMKMANYYLALCCEKRE